jgi:DnaK suppressor protein
MARREELLKRLGGELDELSKHQGSESAGDSADMAFGTGSEEVISQLAELESRELAQIERALARLKQGTYGLCEMCHKKIPVARLNALPFSTTCVQCQREIEMYGASSRYHDRNWDKIADGDMALEEREVNLSDLEMDISK